MEYTVHYRYINITGEIKYRVHFSYGNIQNIQYIIGMIHSVIGSFSVIQFSIYLVIPSFFRSSGFLFIRSSGFGLWPSSIRIVDLNKFA